MISAFVAHSLDNLIPLVVSVSEISSINIVEQARSETLNKGGKAVAWWLMPLTPDLEVGGFEPHSGQTVLCP